MIGHFWIFFPNDRSMAPNGSMYLPYQEFAEDFAAPGIPLNRRAVFVHEATHLYQYYGLGWSVMLRGPFSRNYEYTLQAGRHFASYGLEQMGMIAQHYYILREGGKLRSPYDRYILSDYQSMLPIGHANAAAGRRA